MARGDVAFDDRNAFQGALRGGLYRRLARVARCATGNDRAPCGRRGVAFGDTKAFKGSRFAACVPRVAVAPSVLP